MITLLPESERNILAVQATARLTGSDYTDIWVPRLEAILDRYATARALVYMDAEFKGWDARLWDDVKPGLKQSDDFERIALVGGPQWVRISIKLVIPAIKCPAKLFPKSQLDLAWRWIRTEIPEDLA